MLVALMLMLMCMHWKLLHYHAVADDEATPMIMQNVAPSGAHANGGDVVVDTSADDIAVVVDDAHNVALLLGY